jgi:hypothetical protein
MRAAALVFLAATLFLAAVLTGVVRLGSTQPAPQGIELSKSTGAGARAPDPSRTEVRRTVESSVIARYPRRHGDRRRSG